MKPDKAETPPTSDCTAEAQEPKYGDFLLVDILHPDWRHFFTRYRTDLVGFVVISAIVAFIIVATKWLTMIGADVARQTGAG